jgi:hypothetical protein
MTHDIEEIAGYDLFETPTEKTRIKHLLASVGYNFPNSKIKWLVPNMQKDAEGKITTTGFFVFLEDTIFEFRNFLTSVNFDYAKYDSIGNIRFIEDDLQSPTSLTWLYFRHTSLPDLATTIKVFGAKGNKLLHNIMKELSKFITS